MFVGLAVPYVTAGNGSHPEPVHQLFRGDITPALWNIPFVFALIVDNRFLVLVAPLPCPGKIGTLYAGMCHPWFGVVVKDPAIVNSPHVIVWVVLADDLKETVPVRHCLGLHQVVLIGERPPNIAIGCQSCHYVTQISVVGFSIHIRIAPAIIGVKKNEVGFDSQIEQIANPTFEMPEKFGVETAVIPIRERLSLERIKLRLILIV